MKAKFLVTLIVAMFAISMVSAGTPTCYSCGDGSDAADSLCTGCTGIMIGDSTPWTTGDYCINGDDQIFAFESGGAYSTCTDLGLPNDDCVMLNTYSCVCPSFEANGNVAVTESDCINMGNCEGIDFSHPYFTQGGSPECLPEPPNTGVGPEGVSALAWYDASDTSTIQLVDAELCSNAGWPNYCESLFQGVEIGYWLDKSGNDYDLLAEQVAWNDMSSPELVDNAINGLPALFWQTQGQAAKEYLVNRAFNKQLTDVQFVYVVTHVSPEEDLGANSYDEILNIYDPATGQKLVSRQYKSNLQLQTMLVTDAGNQAPYPGFTTANPSFQYNVPFIGSVKFGDNTLSHYVDGVPQGSKAVTGSVTASALSVGMITDWTYKQNWQGYIGEVVVLDGSDDASRQIVEEYLACKWGLPSCPGPVCTDADGDTYAIEGGECGPIDCDDSNSYVYPGATELCNGPDEDCDNINDNGYNIGVPCSEGVGACAADGVFVCANDHLSTICNAVPGIPSAELCDAGFADEDCDGESNENCACSEGQTMSCGPENPQGACQSGTQTCDVTGIWGDCIGAVYPEDYDTPGNDIDEDCNGEIVCSVPCIEDTLTKRAECGNNVGGWRTHGMYVSCVSNYVDELFLASIIDQNTADAIVEEAAQGYIGQKESLLTGGVIFSDNPETNLMAFIAIVAIAALVIVVCKRKK